MQAAHPSRALTEFNSKKSTPPLSLYPGASEQAPLQPLLFELSDPASTELGRLNQTQRNALDKVATLAPSTQAIYHDSVVRRVMGLGFTEADLQAALEFVGAKASITVNFQLDKVLPEGVAVIDSMMVGGTLKNQFETRISGGYWSDFAGDSRDQWEEILFQGAYHDHPLIPEERPKYGALDIAGFANGGAPQYGNSYLVLKQNVLARTTFTSMDSSKCTAKDVGTATYFEHVLWGVSTPMLRGLLETALGRRTAEVANPTRYIEAQVHGPVDLARDVASVVVSTEFRGTPYETRVKAFAARHNLPLFWHDTKSVFPDKPASLD